MRVGAKTTKKLRIFRNHGAYGQHARTGRVRQSNYTPLWGVPPPRREADAKLLTTLGSNIRAARRSCGVTQERLAELVDLHPRIVQKIEAGENNPKTTTLIRIQAALGCSWEILLPKV